MITLPMHDLPTKSASGFIIRHILPRTGPPQLLDIAARRQLFHIWVLDDLIVAVGHGSPTELCGYQDEILMDTEHFPDVRDRVIVLISCETAQVLGKRLVERYASAYIGFREDLLWVCDADMASMPWQDKLAEPVMMPIVDCLNSILDGKSTGEAFQRLTSSFNSRLDSEEDEFTASLISWNRDSAVLLGTGDARIFKRPPLLLPFKIFPPPPIPFFGR